MIVDDHLESLFVGLPRAGRRGRGQRWRRGGRALCGGPPDLTLPTLDGPTATRHIQDAFPEIQVIALLVNGTTNPAMVTRLGISLGTILLHVTHILRKLGVRNRTEAALFAVQHRLVA